MQYGMRNPVSSQPMAYQEEQDTLENFMTNFIAAKTGTRLLTSEVSTCHIHGKRTPLILL